MGKKKNRNGGENRNDNQENQSNNQQKEENEIQQNPPLLTVVLKMDMHCEDCATKIRKAVRRFKGVDSVRTDLGSDKVTVVGRLDPTKLREFLEQKVNRKEQKVNRKVDQLFPAPKKDKENNNNGGGEKEEEKKPKELPITTAVMKLELHCQGCIQKIRKTIANTKGFLGLSIDEQKNQVTVKEAIDVKAPAETLKETMKKPVEIVPPKKEGGDKKDKDGGEGNNEKGGEGNGWENMQKGGGLGGEGGGVDDESQVVFYPVANYQEQIFSDFLFEEAQIFSDENPNACLVT